MSPSSARSRLAWLLSIALVAGLVYANSLSNDFALDDVPLVRDNPTLGSLGELPSQFLRPYWPVEGETSGLYRPVTIASYNVNHALTGGGAFGYHAGNVFLHVLVCLLAWLALDEVTLHRGTAGVATLLFAVHPLHTEAVANIAGRAELLGALWVLVAWFSHRRSSEASGSTRRVGWAALAAGCYLCALLSKENTVLAPLLFAADDLLRRPRPAGTPIRYPGYAVALALALSLRVLVLGGLRAVQDVAFIDNPAAFADLAVRLATACWVQLRYLALFLWPGTLSSDYSFDAVPVVDSAADLRLWAGLLWMVALTTLVVVTWRRSRAVALGALAWLLFFLPGSNFLFPAGTLMAERLTYLPSLGGCLVLGHLAANAIWGSSRAARAGVLLALAVTLPGLAGRTVSRNPAWSDNASLALTDVRSTPRSAKLHAGAGIVLHARGERAEAEAAYRRALGIYPDYAQIHYNLGELLARSDVDEAIEHLERASMLSTGNPRPYKRLAPLLESVGRRNAALEAYSRGSRLDPTDHPFRFNRGRLLLAMGRTQQALEVLEQLSRDDSDGVPGRLARALARQTRGDDHAARSIYLDLLERPDLSPAIRARVEQQLEALRRTAPPVP
jgi:tetratricopeptide (TPR) repeat protein